MLTVQKLRTMLFACLALVFVGAPIALADGAMRGRSGGTGGLDTATADGLYLRLDTSNDPIDGDLHHKTGSFVSGTAAGSTAWTFDDTQASGTGSIAAFARNGATMTEIDYIGWPTSKIGTIGLKTHSGAQGSQLVLDFRNSSTTFPFNASIIQNTVVSAINKFSSAGGGMSASSGTQSWLRVEPSVVQSGTAGYNAIEADVTETTTGTGARNLLSLSVGGAQQFVVDSTGAVSDPSSNLTLNDAVDVTGQLYAQNGSLLDGVTDVIGTIQNSVGNVTVNDVLSAKQEVLITPGYYLLNSVSTTVGASCTAPVICDSAHVGAQFYCNTTKGATDGSGLCLCHEDGTDTYSWQLVFGGAAAVCP